MRQKPQYKQVGNIVCKTKNKHNIDINGNDSGSKYKKEWKGRN